MPEVKEISKMLLSLLMLVHDGLLKSFPLQRNFFPSGRMHTSIHCNSCPVHIVSTRPLYSLSLYKRIGASLACSCHSNSLSQNDFQPPVSASCVCACVVQNGEHKSVYSCIPSSQHQQSSQSTVCSLYRY